MLFIFGMLFPLSRCSSQLLLYLREIRHRPRVERGRIWTYHPKPGRPFLEDVLEHHRDRSPVSESFILYTDKRIPNMSVPYHCCYHDNNLHLDNGAALFLIFNYITNILLSSGKSTFLSLCVLAYRPFVIMGWYFIYLVGFMIYSFCFSFLSFSLCLS